jgi:hypothetical protein
MDTFIQFYEDIVAKVKVFYEHLKLNTLEKHTGRRLALTIIEIIALAVFKQKNGIPTKKAVYDIFRPNCSYKTLSENMKRYYILAAYILKAIWQANRHNAHAVKRTDTTDIPVCLNKNAKYHRTMQGLATWGHSGKGMFFGLKMGLTDDLFDRTLGCIFAPGNTDDRVLFKKLNKDMRGIFVADAGFISQKLAREFFIENERILFAKPRANMKKLATKFQKLLYDARTKIECHFRELKLFYGLQTSLPRSVDGYFANYVYSLLAYVCA